MIETALFTWKHHEENISLWQAFLWCGSVNWARKHFKNVVLISDEKGEDLLVNKLDFPFTTKLRLPEIPSELLHIYGIAKLMGDQMLAEQNIPFVQIDYDAFLRKALPSRMLSAKFLAEFEYGKKEFAIDINSKLHAPLLIKEGGYAAGIRGGNDCARIYNMCSRSIDEALKPANLGFLITQNGYQASCVFEELASYAEFKGESEFIFPTTQTHQDYLKAGYIHLAGNLKKERGALAQMAIRVQLDFPEQFTKTSIKFDNIYN